MNTTMERPQQQRTRSTFSAKSEKTHKSQNSISKEAEEKRRSHMPTGKANPNAAMNEAQPIAAALEAPTLQSLRSFTHVDTYGNPISEPDLSNPTRGRWERPLDTIKSFEAAIDTEYKRRSILRADTAPDGQSAVQSRRSSFYAGPNDRTQNRQSQMGNHYGNGGGNGRDPYAEQNYGPAGAAPARSRYNQRMPSDSVAGRQVNGNQMYPNAGYHQSRDTVHTGGSGSGSEPWTSNTDPSSDNSSGERASTTRYDQMGDQNGFSGQGGAPIMEEYGHEANYSHPQMSAQGYPPHMPPQSSYPQYPPHTGHFPPNSNHALPPIPPQHAVSKRPIPLGGGASEPSRASGANTSRPQTLSKNNSESGDKRKSWFKRKFNKD